MTSSQAPSAPSLQVSVFPLQVQTSQDDAILFCIVASTPAVTGAQVLDYKQEKPQPSLLFGDLQLLSKQLTKEPGRGTAPKTCCGVPMDCCILHQIIEEYHLMLVIFPFSNSAIQLPLHREVEHNYS